MKKQKVLVIGGGGREHAVCHALLKSNKVESVVCAPGNDGMGIPTVNIAATDIDGIVDYVKQNNIDLTVVTPDDPLALGAVDALNAAGFRAFGPTRAAAKLEWSKAYSKDFMRKYGIPTAEYAVFDDYDQAKKYIAGCEIPVVLKADGLALGKGVLICMTRDEAFSALDAIMKDKAFGSAGSTLVVEQFLEGYEVSLLAFCDGEHFSLMPTSCDHKRVNDNDEGLNTGGMGAYSPCPMFTEGNLAYTVENVVKPTIEGCKAEGAPFKGVLYFGLMVRGDDVKVLEYNARFGDPETQIVLYKLKSDLFDAFSACIDGNLDKTNVEWDSRPGVCVVMASGGYPEHYEKGKAITVGAIDDGVKVFYAGVKNSGGTLVTNGGRVLCVSALGSTGEEAAESAYANIKKISFDGAHYRTDIYNPKK